MASLTEHRRAGAVGATSRGFRNVASENLHENFAFSARGAAIRRPTGSYLRTWPIESIVKNLSYAWGSQAHVSGAAQIGICEAFAAEVQIGLLLFRALQGPIGAGALT